MKSCFVFMFLAATCCGFSQELIVNGDFEWIDKCPVSYIKRYTPNFIPGWQSPTTGTPDVYNRCSKTGAGVPYNWAGVADAQSGDGYVGLLLYGHHEFIKTNLESALNKDTKYVLSFYYRLSSYSMLSIDRMSVRFEGAEEGPYTKEYVKTNSLDKYTGSWELVNDTLTALGGEEYLTIGNFDQSGLTKTTHLFYREGQEPMLENHAYYYIDNVSLTELSSSPEPLDTLRTDVIYTFKNILFEFDQAILDQSSIAELNNLADYLQNHSNLFLEVYGHTDESGNHDYNLDLSIRRAKSVVSYLISYGIDQSRLKYYGFGESKPLRESGAEEAFLNRRVEFQLINGKSN